MSKQETWPSSTLRRMMAETLGERARELTRLGTQLARYDFNRLPRTQQAELLSQAMRTLVLDQELSVSWDGDQEEEEITGPCTCRDCRRNLALRGYASCSCTEYIRTYSGPVSESRSETVGECWSEGVSRS